MNLIKNIFNTQALQLIFLRNKMKVNRLDAHDRFSAITNRENQDIGKFLQSIINRRPFFDYPFYVFVHKKQLGLDERIAMFNKDAASYTPFKARKYNTLSDVETDRLIWQPRLTKPKAVPNTWLFRVQPGSDAVEIVWMLPQEELWDEYNKGKMTENQFVIESIHDYQFNREKLEEKDPRDLSDEMVKKVYGEVLQHISQASSEESSAASLIEGSYQ